MMNQLHEIKRLHARVHGRVQGVGFRYFVLETAASLGLVGWVRNRWDGTVEVLAEGEIEGLRALVQALESGPRSSSVTEVKTDLQDPSGEFASFYVRTTQ
jgi:acylphosphatase